MSETVGERIFVRGLTVDCVIGAYPEERTRPQAIGVDLEMELVSAAGAMSGQLADTCNYDDVAEGVDALLDFRRYGLLEQAATELGAMILGTQPNVRRVAVTLHKPSALRGRARDVAVQAVRCRGQDDPRVEIKPWGRVDVLLETQSAGLYLLHIAPGCTIPLHRHAIMRELEWRVRGALERDGQRLEGMAPVVWPRGRAHAYRNVGAEMATLFCCDCPPFVPSDEVELSGSGTLRPGEDPGADPALARDGAPRR